MTEQNDSDGAESQSTDTDGKTGIPTSRRTTLASLAGLTGIGILGTQPARGTPSEKPRARPWEQDVNAQGHELSTLGSLSMAANSTPITDFAGQNLSIDKSGTLNASSSGGGWGASGEIVHLTSFVSNSNMAVNENSFDTHDDRALAVIPFGDLQYTNIGQLYVSLTGIAAVFGSGTITARIYDETKGSPVSETKTEVTTPDQQAFQGPKAAYSSNQTITFEVQGKLTDAGEFANGKLFNPTVHVWGEIE